MVYVEMGGRCGNQLFHYAVARYIQLKSGDNQLMLNYAPVLNKHREAEGWYDMLAEYKTVPYTYYDKEGTVLKNETTLLQKLLVGLKAIHIKLYSKKDRQTRANKASVGQKILNKVGVYWVREGVDKIFVGGTRNSIVTGVCETPFIYEIRDVLQKELEPKAGVLPQNVELYNNICNSESVCVSVRRGDFFSAENRKQFAVCTEQYYVNAKNIMDSQLRNKKNVKYFVFSDDIEWCKKSLGLENCTFVSQNMPVYETLRLMYSCKHFIVSNSTFSWWGQFLSRNKDKIVVSPSRWNNEGYDSHLIGKDWILIDG